MYAYLFGNLVVLGVDVLGHSQLAGSPKIPEWGIPLPQYPRCTVGRNSALHCYFPFILFRHAVILAV